MANITATQLLTAGTASSGSSFNTASITVIPNTVIIAAVGLDNGGSPAPTTTLSGLSLTWTQIATKTTPDGSRRITLFRAVTTVDNSGVVGITHSGTAGDGTNWSFTQFFDIALSGTNGSDAVVQSADASSDATTSLTANLGGFSSVDNATYAALFKNGSENISVGSGFSQLGQSNVSRSIIAEYKNTNDTSADFSWNSNHAVTMIALELKYQLYVPPTTETGYAFFM